MDKLGLDFGNVIYKEGGLYPGLAEAMPALRDAFKSEIYVISRVDDEAGAQCVREFLAGEGAVLGIPEANANFCLLRPEKGPIAERLGLTHFVDDRTECLHYMTSVRRRYALNPQKWQMAAFPPDGMTVVESWDEAAWMILATRKE